MENKRKAQRLEFEEKVIREGLPKREPSKPYQPVDKSREERGALAAGHYVVKYIAIGLLVGLLMWGIL